MKATQLTYNSDCAFYQWCACTFWMNANLIACFLYLFSTFWFSTWMMSLAYLCTWLAHLHALNYVWKMYIIISIWCTAITEWKRKRWRERERESEWASRMGKKRTALSSSLPILWLWTLAIHRNPNENACSKINQKKGNKWMANTLECYEIFGVCMYVLRLS